MLLAALEFPPIEHLFDWEKLLLEDVAGGKFAVTKTVLLVWLAAVIVAVMFFTAGRKKELVPTGVRNVVEMSIDFVERGIAREIMGPEGVTWVPFLTTMMYFIFFMNLFEIIPILQFPPTSRMSLPLYMAVQTWLIFLFVGIKTQGPLTYLRNSVVPPGVPKALYVLVVPIEFLSTFLVRPFSLAVRLFANMMAGHLLLVSFYVICAALWTKSVMAAILPLPFATLVGLVGFELLVAVLQAYIFTILTAVYISDSLSTEH